MSIMITEWDYLFANKFDEKSFEHRDSRLMDKQTKILVSMARKLNVKANASEIKSENLGIVLLSDTGPIDFIKAYNSILKKKGYVGINPSKFPNIMSATPLSRVAIEIGAKGPCIPLLSSKDNKHALIYTMEQIAVGRCQAMMFMHISQGMSCFGCFIENGESLNKRGINPKLIISEKGR